MAHRLSGGFQILLLDTHHERDNFACGAESIDRYLKTQAGQDVGLVASCAAYAPYRRNG